MILYLVVSGRLEYPSEKGSLSLRDLVFRLSRSGFLVGPYGPELFSFWLRYSNVLLGVCTLLLEYRGS